MAYFNTSFADGRWAHFMDQSHLGYTTWRDPPKNSLEAITLVEPVVPLAAGLGVAVEGSEPAWPGASGAPQLPVLDALNRQSAFVEVFNRGKTPFTFGARPSAPWIVLSETGGEIGADRRIQVSVDWDRAPAGRSEGSVSISGAGQEVVVGLSAVKPSDVTRDNLGGFAENAGVIAIEPEHFSLKTDTAAYQWARIADYGRTLSGMRVLGPVDAAPAVPGKTAALLEYEFYCYTGGAPTVTAITAPTLNFVPGRGLRYAIAVDDEAPRTVEVVPADYKSQNRNRAWEKSVGDNAHHAVSHHTVIAPGYHRLNIWGVDSAVVLQKIVIDLGGARPSYLGPTESYHRMTATAK
jgi:hypothetical protein